MSIEKKYYRNIEVSRLTGIAPRSITEWTSRFKIVVATTAAKAPLYSKEHIAFFRVISSITRYFSVEGIRLFANEGMAVTLHGKKIDVPKITMYK